ncbi:MAG: type II secretion system protein GspD [bacterium]
MRIKGLLHGLFCLMLVSQAGLCQDISIVKIKSWASLLSHNAQQERVVQEKDNPYWFPRTVSLSGSMTLYDALSMLTQTNVTVIFKDDHLSDRKIAVNLSTRSIPKFINLVCYAGNVWCDYNTKNRTLVVKSKRTFFVHYYPEGQLTFSIGSAANSGSGGSSGNNNGSNSGSGSGSGNNNQNGSQNTNQSGGQQGSGSSSSDSSSIQYSISNLSYDTFLAMLKQLLGINPIPSQKGFIMFRATPKEWEKIKDYFEKQQKEQRVVYASIQLYRIDLKRAFQWGVNWNALTNFFLTNTSKTLNLGFQGLSSSGSGSGGFNGGITANVFAKDASQLALISALSTFGSVHKVDSWYYQMTTGTPIPFRDYQIVNYFTVGSSQSQSSTELTENVNQVEVGFRGVLSVYKQRQGYYVDGFIDLSSVAGYDTMKTQFGTLSAPEIVGKSFRIATYLKHLNSTLVIGGFTTLGISDNENGVPLLRRFPILGLLFKGKNDLSQNSEFVVVITLKKAKYGLNNIAHDVITTTHDKMPSYMKIFPEE